MRCSNCRTICNPNAVFCGRCGLRLGSVNTAGLPGLWGEQTREKSAQNPFLDAWRLHRRLFVSVTGLVLVALLLISFIALRQFGQETHAPSGVAQPVAGSFQFEDTYATMDGLSLRVAHLQSLPGNQVYTAWLVNGSRPHQMLLIGRLNPDQQGNVMLDSKNLASFNPDHKKLPENYPDLLITREPAEGDLQFPSSLMVARGHADPQKVLAWQPLVPSNSAQTAIGLYVFKMGA